MHVLVATPARFDIFQAICCYFTFTDVLLRGVPFQIKSEVGFCTCESHGLSIFVCLSALYLMLKISSSLGRVACGHSPMGGHVLSKHTIMRRVKTGDVVEEKL